MNSNRICVTTWNRIKYYNKPHIIPDKDKQKIRYFRIDVLRLWDSSKAQREPLSTNEEDMEEWGSLQGVVHHSKRASRTHQVGNETT